VRVGEILRDPYHKDHTIPEVDGYANLYYLTNSHGGRTIPFAKGINPIASIKGMLQRRPAVIIRSSPHKAGSEGTPWQDRFDPDRGHIRYFGDNKFSENPRGAFLRTASAVDRKLANFRPGIGPGCRTFGAEAILHLPFRGRSPYAFGRQLTKGLRLSFPIKVAS